MIVADQNILKNMHIDPSQDQKIPLLTTHMETLGGDKHVIAKLQLVPFWIINLMPLTADVCMKEFESKVTKGFSFSPLWDSCSSLHEKKKIKKNLWDQNIQSYTYKCLLLL